MCPSSTVSVRIGLLIHIPWGYDNIAFHLQTRSSKNTMPRGNISQQLGTEWFITCPKVQLNMIKTLDFFSIYSELRLNYLQQCKTSKIIAIQRNMSLHFYTIFDRQGCQLFESCLIQLWHTDATWRHSCRLPLVHAMACCRFVAETLLALCWIILNWILRNKHWRNVTPNAICCCEKYSYQSVVRLMPAILCRFWCVKQNQGRMPEPRSLTGVNLNISKDKYLHQS